jgi:hypothetical protein
LNTTVLVFLCISIEKSEENYREIVQSNRSCFQYAGILLEIHFGILATAFVW